MYCNNELTNSAETLLVGIPVSVRVSGRSKPKRCAGNTNDASPRVVKGHFAPMKYKSRGPLELEGRNANARANSVFLAVGFGPLGRGHHDL